MDAGLPRVAKGGLTMDTDGFGKVYDAVVWFAAVGIVAIGVLMVAVPVGVVWGLWWAWHHVSVH